MNPRVWPILLVLLVAAVDSRAERKWREKEGCTLIDNPANDGDSFHVKWHTQQYLFRLLFVDTCESEGSLPDRIAEQAAYFGISSPDVIRAGKEAKKFSENWLKKDSFTAFTQFDDAMGRSKMDRDYAMITRGDEDLAVELVRNGLARIFGKQEVPDDLASVQTIRFRLKKAELEAKEGKRGAWGYAAPAGPGGLPVTVPNIPEQKIVTSRTFPVYSLASASQTLGYLTPGKEITVLKAESAAMVRIRFSTAAGQVIEAQCRRVDVGL